MPLLHTALQDGFDDDEVVLRVAGRDVFHQPHVRTRNQIGLAATHEVSLGVGPVSVEIVLPRRKLELKVPLQITQDTYLGVSLTPQGEFRHVVTYEPFGYV